MSDTAPIRRPRMTSGQRRTVGVGDLISAVSSYGVTKMTDNVNAGDMRKRISVMFVVILGVLSLVYLRVVVLQTWKAGGYREMSVNQRTKSNVIPAERGAIYDRDGAELAIPIPTRTIFADPREVTDPVTTARALGMVLQLTPEAEMDLASRLQNKASSFTYVVRQVDSAIAQAVLDLNLPGVSSYREEGRALTTEGLRPLIGRTDLDDRVVDAEAGEGRQQVLDSGNAYPILLQDRCEARIANQHGICRNHNWFR